MSKEIPVDELTLEEARAELRVARAERDSFRRLADLSSEFLVEADADYRVVACNARYAARFGARAEELVGRRIEELVGPEPYRLVRGAIEAGEKLGLEYEAEYEGRGRRWMKVEFDAWRDSAGKVLGVRGAAVDITQRRVVELELRKANQLLEGIIDNVEALIFVKDGEGRYRLINRAFEEAFGRARSELIGRTDFDVFSAEQAKGFIEHDEEVRRSGDGVMVEERAPVRGELRSYFVSKFPLKDERGTVELVCGMATDITAYKRLEEELREQAALLDLAHDAIIVRDMEGRIRFWNRASEEVYGWKAGEVMGRVSHDLFQTQFESSAEEVMTGVLRDGSWRGELTHQRKDGGELVVDSRWALRRDAEGRPTGVLEINRDITRRTRAEQAAREKQARLVAALDAAGAGTFQWDIQTNEVKWDESLDRLFGLAPGESARSLEVFIGMVHPEDREGVIERCERCAQTGADFEMEFRVIWRDGSEHWLYDRGKTIFDETGRPIQMIGACVDITERKRTEQRLRAAETREKIILEHLPVGVWFLDKGGKLAYGNKVAQEIWGGAKYVEIKRFDEYKGWWHETGAAISPFEWAAARAFEEKKAYLNQLVDIESFDGKRKTMMNSAAPIVSPSGEFEGVVVFNLDVTEQARMQAALRRSHDELEERVAERTAELRETIEALEAFSYSISHDMRSPLRAMQGFSETLLREHGGELSEEAQDLLTRINRAAHRLDLLILDVLTYGRVAKEEIEMRPINLDGLVTELVASYPSFQAPEAAVMVEGPLGDALGHPAFLSQVFSNLLANAVKFVEPGAQPRVVVRAEREGGDLRVSVQDNGIGIEPEHRDRIFQIFGRVHPAKKYPGTGIGLAVVKKAVERMGGRIGFDSAPGRGSTFWFTLRSN